MVGMLLVRVVKDFQRFTPPNKRHNIALADSEDEIGCAGVICDYDANVNYQELYKVLNVITDLPK